MSATCKSCGGAIVWIVNRITGSRVPLDAQPLADGRALFVIEDDDRGRPTGGPVHVNHFVTCPTREQHRKPKPLTDALAERAE